MDGKLTEIIMTLKKLCNNYKVKVENLPAEPYSSTGNCLPHWHLASVLPQSLFSHHRTQ